jgi:hypothetical protein
MPQGLPAILANIKNKIDDDAMIRLEDPIKYEVREILEVEPDIRNRQRTHLEYTGFGFGHSGH